VFHKKRNLGKDLSTVNNYHRVVNSDSRPIRS